MNGGCLLDTNVLSETLRPLPNAGVAAWLESQNKDSQFLSVVTIGELRRGATLLSQGSRRTQLERFIDATGPSWFTDRVLPVTQAVAEHWGILDAQRQATGRPLGVADGMVAATALEHGLTLVTRNTKDFGGLGLALFNPWAAYEPAGNGASSRRTAVARGHAGAGAGLRLLYCYKHRRPKKAGWPRQSSAIVE